MESIHCLIRQSLLAKAGLVDRDAKKSLSDLFKTEWSSQFEKYMRNRLVMGAMRYGRLGSTNKPQYDRIDSIRKRLKAYEQTGNDELLVDIANLCLLEFVEGKHPNKHFSATDDTNERVKAL